MKKLLFALLVVSSLAYAEKQYINCSDADVQSKIVSRLTSHNRTSVTINYSQDKTTEANACKAVLMQKDPSLTNVNLNKVAESGTLNFSK